MEIESLSDPKKTKIWSCEKCNKVFTARYKINHHKCVSENVITYKKKGDNTTKYLKKKFTNLEEAVKAKETIDDIVDKYEKANITNVTNNNTLNTQNNNQNLTVILNVSDINMSSIVTEKFLNDLCRTIKNPLIRNKEIDSEKYVMESNNVGRPKTSKFYRSLSMLDNERARNVEVIQDGLVSKIFLMYIVTFFTEKNPDFHYIYIETERASDNFYIRTNYGWTKSGDDEFLRNVVVDMYNILKGSFAVCKKPNTEKLMDNFYKEHYNLITATAVRNFRRYAYDNRHIVKPTYEATKDLTYKSYGGDDDFDDIELSDIDDIEDYDDPKPTYVLKSESENDAPVRNTFEEEIYDKNHKQYDEDDDEDDVDEDDISESDIIYTSDGVALYEEKVGKRIYYVAIERNNAMYENIHKKDVRLLDMDKLIIVGNKIGKGNYDLFNE